MALRGPSGAVTPARTRAASVASSLARLKVGTEWAFVSRHSLEGRSSHRRLLLQQRFRLFWLRCPGSLPARVIALRRDGSSRRGSSSGVRDVLPRLLRLLAKRLPAP